MNINKTTVLYTPMKGGLFDFKSIQEQLTIALNLRITRTFHKLLKDVFSLIYHMIYITCEVSNLNKVVA